MDEPEPRTTLWPGLMPTTPARGSVCRDARRLLNISQRELAVLAAATFRDVSDLENDREAQNVHARAAVLGELVGLLADELRKNRRGQ